MLKREFEVTEAPELEISVACNVRIEPTNYDSVYVTAIGDESQLEKLEVYQQGDTIIIRQELPSYSFGNGNVVIGGNGVTYINSGRNVHVGEVYVNGQRVQTGGYGENAEQFEPVEITIYCPAGADLDLDLSGEAAFLSLIPLSKATLDCSGAAQVGLTQVEDLDLELSGSVKLKVAHVSGRLSIDASGACNIDIKGEYERVSIDASGAGRICTHGTCHGNYIVDASGACSVTHYGVVEGRVKRDVSGVARVNVG